MDGDVTMEVSKQDQVRFDSTLIEFGKVFHKDIADVLVQQARLICVNLAWNTQPYGLDQNTLKQGQAATLRDIARVYRSIDSIYAGIAAKSEIAAKAYFKAAKAGDQCTVQRLLYDYGLPNLTNAPFGPFDDGKRHKAARDRRGRVSRRGLPYIVTNPAALRKYTKEKLKNVGTAKSAWASCARQLGGTRGIPLWATRGKGRGTVEDRSHALVDQRVILQAQVDYMGIVCPPDMQRDALEKQRAKMQTAIREAADRAVRRSRLAA